MASQSPCTVVVSAVEKAGGRLMAYDFSDFKRQTDCGLRESEVGDGLREARNIGLLKLKKAENDPRTLVRRTDKNA